MTDFISDYLGEIVVFLLSAILASATEIWFPATDSKQKHFWAAMLFVLSAALGLSVNGTFKMNKTVSQLTEAVNKHDAFAKQELKLHLVARDYEQVTDRASGTLRKWGGEALKALEDDLNEGYIPISRELAPTTIAAVYADSKTSIIASNVGSIDFYFNVPAYQQQNKLARDHHVPVVRFFIYSNSGHRNIKLTKSCESQGLRADSIEDFKRCVNQINTLLGSLCSVVVDFDSQYARIGDLKDLLIMDNSFVAQTELYSEDWMPRRAKATELNINAAAIKDARDFFHNLWGITGDTCVGRMEDRDILSYFPQYRGVQREKNQPLADAAFHQVMVSVTGSPTN